MEFDHGPYRAQYETREGRFIWELLQTGAMIWFMARASDDGRPALEGNGHFLGAMFSAQVADDETKKMIGRMVRQVLEANGYDWDSRGHDVKGPAGEYFSQASLYRAREIL